MMDRHRLAACGQPMQLPFVPDDVGKALEYWTGVMGAGPFFHIPHINLENTIYKGAPTAPDFSLWLGHWGDMQIELIAQHSDAPSIYLGAGDDRRLHHICILVADFTQALEAAQGMEPLQQADVPGGGTGPLHPACVRPDGRAVEAGAEYNRTVCHDACCPPRMGQDICRQVAIAASR